jgi:hypothetical protein
MSLTSVSAAVFEDAASPDWTALSRFFRSVRSVDCALFVAVAEVVEAVEVDVADDVERLAAAVLELRLSNQL